MPPRNTRHTARIWIALALALTLTPGVAAAEEPPPRYTPFVDRGNALPAPYAYATLGGAGTLKSGDASTLEGALGAGVGLSARVWIDGSAGSVQVKPEVGYHSPQIGLNALLVDTPGFELSATTHVTFAAADGRPVEQVEPGAFAVMRFAHRLRVDSGLYVNVNPGPTPTLGLRLPLSVGFQLGEKVHATINGGVTVGDVADAAGSTAIPFGVTLGWSDRLGAHGPSVGLVPTIGFPELIKPGAEQVFRPGYATVGLTLVYVSKL